MIALVDYGLGNIQAFANIYRRLGISATAVNTPAALKNVTKIILPGVGAFDWAMQKLNDSGLRDALDKVVLERKIDVLGVCVGMQMMAQRSEEGKEPGLGWLDAEVARFNTSAFNPKTHLPHMGWNDAKPTRSGTLFRNIETHRYYFLHSYYIVPNQTETTLATSSYGTTFASAVNSGNVYGTQFHPEKSHNWGIRLLQNFSEIQ